MKPSDMYKHSMRARKLMMNAHLIKVDQYPILHSNYITSLVTMGNVDTKASNVHAWFKSN